MLSFKQSIVKLLAVSAGAVLLGTAVEAAEKPHLVFVTGDEEYRSEESMPMLGKILHRDYGFKVTVCYALAEDGTIDPVNAENIAGLEALDEADMMILFTRFRRLPDEQLKHIVDFAESGKPMAGFRTATHAFRYKSGPHVETMNEAWPIEVFGQKWITHHGHFGDGHEFLTDVTLIDAMKDHPALRGVGPFKGYSWLYHVDGGEHKLSGDSKPLLTGRALKSNHEKRGNLDRFQLTNPVAWTKTYTGTSGKTARVFFTTLGHSFDFKQESMRKLALNGILWALGMEDQIPAGGAKADFVDPYEPYNSGFGKFKPGMKPEPIGR